MTTRAPDDVRSWAQAMQLAFVVGDLGEAVGIAEAATGTVEPIELLDEVVAPAMRHVGLLWESDMVSVADEHLATATVHRLLAAVAPSLRRAAPESRGELVLLATTSSELHMTPLLMAEAVLRGAGYRVNNLGAGVPLSALRSMVADDPPALIGLSATMPLGAELRAATTALSEAAPETMIVVGGNDLPRDIGPAEPVTSLRDLQRLLRI